MFKLADPPSTPYDLNFEVFQFPVRVHWSFWLFGLISGLNLFPPGLRGEDGGSDYAGVLIWMSVLFVSILIHELGHTFMMRRYGREAYIVLYWMGGLAIEGNPNPYAFSYQPREHRTPREQIDISAAGPLAQIGLALLVAALVKLARGEVAVYFAYGFFPNVIATPPVGSNMNLAILVHCLVTYNIWWALLNLFPVYPLDGGQIALQLLIQRDPWGGFVKAMQLSMVVGGAMAIFSFLTFSTFTALLFASLAVQAYMTLQQIRGQGGRGGRDW